MPFVPGVELPVVETGPMDTCVVCGAERDPRDPDSLAWSVEREADGPVRWLCPPCVRRHVRDIEAKLAPDWW